MTVKMGYRIKDAAAFVGVSPSKFRQMVRDHRMPGPYTIDGMKLWRYDELKAAFDALTSGEGEANNPWDAAVG